MINDQDFLTHDPLVLFERWFNDAVQTNQMREPRAMTLATLSENNQIHARIVLLKEINKQGLVFFTNYGSIKGQDLQAHAQCEAVFYWDLLQKQVRVHGTVEKVPRSVSEEYWNSRPRESQLSQHISRQSTPCPDRATLESAVARAEQEFLGKPIPCPSHWGGYQITPTRFEFWVGQPGRLHDRFEFKKMGQTWTSYRLYP